MQGTVTMLGTGTSTGVPTLGCECAVCTSADPRDRRLRPSIWIQYGGHSIVIDTPPDFRTQALRAGIKSVDAVLFTHAHADHVMGMDDIRPFNFGRAEPIPIYAEPGTMADLERIYRYVFENHYPESAIPRVAAHVVQGPIDLFGVRFEPLPVLHGKLPVLGYRFGDNAYVTDFSEIPPASLERLRGLDLLILDALRIRPHPTHSNLENSIRLVQALQPRRAYFTHIAHEIAHAVTEASLPPTTHLGYDNLELTVEL